MTINRVAGTTGNLSTARPEPQRKPQTLQSTEDIAARLQESHPLNPVNTQETRDVFKRITERGPDSDRDEMNAGVRIDRNDQARDALKARFEENSRPKWEPVFEVRV
jgi:hypothetical protein